MYGRLAWSLLSTYSAMFYRKYPANLFVYLFYFACRDLQKNTVFYPRARVFLTRMTDSGDLYVFITEQVNEERNFC